MANIRLTFFYFRLQITLFFVLQVWPPSIEAFIQGILLLIVILFISGGFLLIPIRIIQIVVVQIGRAHV